MAAPPDSTQASPSAWHRLDLWLARMRPHREPLSLLADALVIAACWNITYLFRLGFERWISARPGYDALVLLGVIAIYLITFKVLRVPQSMWRFAGFGEVKRLTLACAIAGVASAAVVMGLGLAKVPRAVLALHPIVALMGVIVVRIGYRMLYEHARARITGGSGEIRRAIVMGAGAAARLLLAGIHEQGWVVLGLLDDDPAKSQARIGGVPVLGPLDAGGRQGGAGRRHAHRRRAALGQRSAASARAGAGRHHRPAGRDRADGGRAAHRQEPHRAAARHRARRPAGPRAGATGRGGIGEALHGKVVLITGAGGSIGSELCRQVARFGPARLVLYELSEFNLYSIEQELSEAWPQLPLARLIGDVKDLAHLRAGLRALAAGSGVPRCGLQARAADGGRQRLGGAAQQHAGHLPRARWPRPKPASSASC